MSTEPSDFQNVSVNCDIDSNNEQCAICHETIVISKAGHACPCMHQFCFDCLKQWCEIKAECPLCKQKIEKVFFDVESLQAFKEFYPNFTADSDESNESNSSESSESIDSDSSEDDEDGIEEEDIVTPAVSLSDFDEYVSIPDLDDSDSLDAVHWWNEESDPS